MLVNEEVFTSLEKAGWQPEDKGKNDKPLTHDVFEVHTKWNFSAYRPTLEHLLKTAEFFGGVPFASLKEVRKWKVASGRPKDLGDVELIDGVLFD